MPPEADVEVLTLSSDDEDASSTASTSHTSSAAKQSPSKSGSSTKSAQNDGKNPSSGAMKRKAPSGDSPQKDEASGDGEGKKRKTGAEDPLLKSVNISTSAAAPASTSTSTSSSAAPASSSSGRFQLFVTRPPSGKSVNGDHLRQPLKHLLNPDGPDTTLSALITGFELDWKTVKEAAFGSKGNAKSRISVVCDKIAFPGKLTLKDLEKAAPGVVVKVVEPYQKIGNHAKVVILERQPPIGPAYLTVVIWSGNLNGPHSLTLENAGVVFTLPLLSSPASSPAANPTHTSFSRDLYAFLASKKLQQGAQSKAFLDVFSRYDFSATEKCRLVWSLGGKHNLSNTTLDQAALGPGGLGALAQGVKVLRRVKGGDFAVEWLGTSFGYLDIAFLQALFAAVQGVEPQHRVRDQHILAPFDVEKIKIVCPAYGDISSATDRHKGVVNWTQEDWDEMKPEDQRRATFYRCKIKSGRISHTKTLLIIHTPANSSDEHEAFLYVGSHNPTRAAWGDYSHPSTVTFQAFELGVLTKFSASTKEGLEVEIERRVTYERPLVRYGEGDAPCVKREGGRGK